jgi:polar amino acid transport system substrate-binding protein
MKRTRLCCLLVLMATFSAGVEARDLDSIKKSGVLILATEGAFTPFNYFKGNQLTGYEVEVGEAVAHHLGLAAEWHTLAFEAQIAAVAQDRFDAAIASHGITPERLKAVDFANPHYCSGAQMASLADGPRTAAQLAGKIVAVQLGTTYVDDVRKIPGIKEVRTLPKDTDAQQALVAHRVDAWVADRFSIREGIKRNAAAGLVKGEMLSSERNAMVIRKGNDKLREAVNQALDELAKDGTLKKLSAKYFDEDITCQAR